MEVVYKTAIYNMKNEKLTKPAKTKETKGPRYINDIICGSKVKKSSSTDKHGKSKFFFTLISNTNFFPLIFFFILDSFYNLLVFIVENFLKLFFIILKQYEF